MNQSRTVRFLSAHLCGRCIDHIFPFSISFQHGLPFNLASVSRGHIHLEKLVLNPSSVIRTWNPSTVLRPSHLLASEHASSSINSLSRCLTSKMGMVSSFPLLCWGEIHSSQAMKVILWKCVTFSTDIILCNHHLWSQNMFIAPTRTSAPTSHPSAFLPTRPATGPCCRQSLPVSMHLLTLDTAHKWNYPVWGILCLASFTRPGILAVHWSCGM